jgi:hypothetical protein
MKCMQIQTVQSFAALREMGAPLLTPDPRVADTQVANRQFTDFHVADRQIVDVIKC